MVCPIRLDEFRNRPLDLNEDTVVLDEVDIIVVDVVIDIDDEEEENEDEDKVEEEDDPFVSLAFSFVRFNLKSVSLSL